MKSTEIVRKIDPLGRIVMPIELRNLLNIDNNSELEIFVDSDKIILGKYNKSCYLCGSNKNLARFRNKNVCRNCINEF